MTPEEWRSRGIWRDCAGRRTFIVHDPGPAAPAGTILCLHGFPTSSWDWVPLWSELTKTHRVVAYDFLGFGFSEKPDVRLRIDEQADISEALIETLDLGYVHLLAHDYGDTVAQELLARDNGRADPRLQSVMFLNGGLFPETHRARLIQKLLASPLGPVLSRLLGRRAFARSFSAVFGAKTHPSEAELDAFWSIISSDGGRKLFHLGIHYMAERRMNRERWLDALKEAAVPLGLINGSADPVSGAHMVARYRELVPREDFIVELPPIGHYPQVEDPQGVLQAYRSFLERV